MKLTTEQLDKIQRLLEEELRDACRSAVDGGARPADIAVVLADRRRALKNLLSHLPDDAQDSVDHAGESGGIGEKG